MSTQKSNRERFAEKPCGDPWPSRYFVHQSFPCFRMNSMNIFYSLHKIETDMIRLNTNDRAFGQQRFRNVDLIFYVTRRFLNVKMRSCNTSRGPNRSYSCQKSTEFHDDESIRCKRLCREKLRKPYVGQQSDSIGSTNTVLKTNDPRRISDKGRVIIVVK